MKITTTRVSASGEAWALADGEAHWIFPAREAETVNQYADFLHVFESDELGPGILLRISADSDFALWLNGQLVGNGQYSNYPDAKTYECFSVADLMREGRNTLAMTVFYNGRTSSVYRRGEPGLLFEVRKGDQVLAASGTETLCRANPSYHSGPIAIVSGQLAYTFGYDARGEDQFWKEDYLPGDEWRKICEAEATSPADRVLLQPRPVPRLVDGGLTASRLLRGGRFRYDIESVAAELESKAVQQGSDGLVLASGDVVSPACLMQRAEFLPMALEEITSAPQDALLDDQPDGVPVAAAELDGVDGVFLLLDLGCEEAGHLVLDLEAKPGTIIDVGYGEHLDDGRVRSFVGRRSFGARYICGEGRSRFTHHFLRWAGRYLQLCVHAGEFTLHQCALERREYPVSVRGCVDTGSALHERLHGVGCRTLHLCMHEHYEDTPWREQALYANDARTQALCGYYAFGETAMPAASFALLGNGLRDDGFINLTAPAKSALTIPSFTFAWMLAVRDHFLFSGDDFLARAFLPQMCSMLNSFLAERKGGLLPLRRANNVWNFYDWSAGMSGYPDGLFDDGLDADAPLNCFLIMALEAVRQVQQWCGVSVSEEFAVASDSLRDALVERFWVPGEDACRTHDRADSYTELTQALAVLAGVGDGDMRARMLERMARGDSGLAGPGLSQSFYTFEALMTRKELYGRKVLQDIEGTWGQMLEAGATTFWETIRGASDFSNAGSLCHGWSAAPVYILYHDVLGVQPLEPGFRRFVVEPLSGVVPACTGRVPIGDGEIIANWSQTEDGGIDCEVKAPEGLEKVDT